MSTDFHEEANILGGTGRLCGYCAKEVPETETLESHLLVAHGMRKCAADECSYVTGHSAEFCLDHANAHRGV